MEELIQKETQNTSKLQVLEEREAMEIAEEQYHGLEEARLNLKTPLTSEAENYRGARPKTTLRVKATSIVPSTLLQEAVVSTYSDHSRFRQEQLLKDHVALLRDEVFNVILGTVNMQHGTASQNKKIQSSSDISEDEVFHLPQVPDMPIAGSGHGHKVTSRSLVVRPALVSSTPHLVPQPVSFDLSGITNTETSWKDKDSEAEGRPNIGTRSGLTHTKKSRRMRQDASITKTACNSWLKNFKRSADQKFKR